jgi:hypothetical protein
MQANVASRLETSTPTLLELVAQINEGEVKVPAFQREFVWKEEQALELLDSLASNYPVGSLLLWRTADKLATERNIGNFKLPVTDDHSPTDYVLDGQQRLTVIYSCLGAPEGQGGFAAGYDLAKDQEAFVIMPETPALTIFPLRILNHTSRLLDFRTALQTLPDKEVLQTRLDGIVRVLTNYRLPVVTLKNLTLEEVCPIFERINSSGTRLSTYDLMVAATWSKTFDLNEKAMELAKSLETKDFDEIEGTTILKALAATHSFSADRDAIVALRKLDETELNNVVKQTKGSLERAVDFVTTDLRVHSLDFLPYEAHLTVLTGIYRDTKNLNIDQVRRARSWFWRTAFTDHYRGAADTFVSKSIKEARAYVLEGKGDPAKFGEPPSEAALLRPGFRKNSSSSRAFALAMAKIGPRNLTNGLAIDTHQALSIYNKHQFHHLFPIAFMRRTSPTTDANLLMNICMLAAKENLDVRDANPNEYLPRLIVGLGPDVEAVFESNLLPPPSMLDYGTVGFTDFLDARALYAADWIQKLCSGEK